MKKTFAILISLIFLCGSVRAEGIMNVAFKQRASLNVETVRLRDLVDAENTALDFVKKFGDVKIEIAEDAENVDHSTVLSALLAAGADVGAIRFLGNAGVTLERGQRIDLPQNVADGVESLLNADYGVPRADVSVRSARIRPKLPSAELASLKFSGLAAEDLSDLNRSRFSVSVESENGDRASYSLFLDLSVETAVVTAAIDLEAGQSLMETDYVSGRAPLKSIPGRLVAAGDLKGRPFKTLANLRKDDVLTAERVGEVQQVKKGTPVTLSYKTGMLSIQANGVLADDAEIGATVQVENADSKRLVSGRLVKKNEVEVGYAN